MISLKGPVLGERNAAFLSLVAKCSPFDHNLVQFKAGEQVWRVLMLARFDGLFGFPGGMVDPGEAPLDAAIREAEEEVGLIVDPAKAQWLCSHTNGQMNFHNFLVEVDEATLRAVLERPATMPEHRAEVCGVVAPYIHRATVEALRSWPMAGSASQELKILINILADQYGYLFAER
jgi:8-oxo-dGTP pyrophosphatase MutT (NUDIX family)